MLNTRQELHDVNFYIKEMIGSKTITFSFYNTLGVQKERKMFSHSVCK